MNTVKNSTSRIEWVDIAKGVGIVLVVFAHTTLPHELRKIIYSFHMPLFFFLSGYLFSLTKYNRFSRFFSRRVTTLLVPYLFLSIINFVVAILLQLFRTHTVSVHDFSQFLLKLVGGVRDSGYGSYNDIFWFILSLFIVELAFYLILSKFKSQPIVVVGIVVASSLVGYWYARTVHAPLPWGVDASLMALPFYAVGYYARTRKAVAYVADRIWLLIALLAANLVLGVVLNVPVDMYARDYGNYVLYYGSAICGILWVVPSLQILASKGGLLLGKWLFRWFGKNSLLIYGLHQYSVFPFVLLFVHLLFKHFHQPLVFHGLYAIEVGVFQTIYTIAVLVPIIYILNTYFLAYIGRTGTGLFHKFTLAKAHA